MRITATEFKSNLGRYLSMVDSEDIIITKNGKPIAELIAPRIEEKIAALHRLIGIAKADGNEEITLEQIRNERLAKQCK